MAAARSALKIGMIPADGIGREVLPVSSLTISVRKLLRSANGYPRV